MPTKKPKKKGLNNDLVARIASFNAQLDNLPDTSDASDAPDPSDRLLIEYHLLRTEIEALGHRVKEHISDDSLESFFPQFSQYRRNVPHFKRLASSRWKLCLDELVEHFGEDVISSLRFVENLNTLCIEAHREVNTTRKVSKERAIQSILAAAKARTNGGLGRQGVDRHKKYAPCDVTMAMTSLDLEPPTRNKGEASRIASHLLSPGSSPDRDTAHTEDGEAPAEMGSGEDMEDVDTTETEDQAGKKEHQAEHVTETRAQAEKEDTFTTDTPVEADKDKSDAPQEASTAIETQAASLTTTADATATYTDDEEAQDMAHITRRRKSGKTKSSKAKSSKAKRKHDDSDAARPPLAQKRTKQSQLLRFQPVLSPLIETSSVSHVSSPPSVEHGRGGEVPLADNPSPILALHYLPSFAAVGKTWSQETPSLASAARPRTPGASSSSSSSSRSDSPQPAVATPTPGAKALEIALDDETAATTWSSSSPFQLQQDDYEYISSSIGDATLHLEVGEQSLSNNNISPVSSLGTQQDKNIVSQDLRALLRALLLPAREPDAVDKFPIETFSMDLEPVTTCTEPSRHTVEAEAASPIPPSTFPAKAEPVIEPITLTPSSPAMFAQSSELSRFEGESWLSDDCIRLAISLVKLPQQRLVMIGNSHVIKDWQTWADQTTPYRISAYTQQLFVPLMQDDHWTLFVINNRHRTIEHFNSMPQLPVKDAPAIGRALLRVTFVPDGVTSQWTFFPRPNAPRQTNTYDCGMFVILSAWYTIADLPLPPYYDTKLWRQLLPCLLQPNDEKLLARVKGNICPSDLSAIWTAKSLVSTLLVAHHQTIRSASEQSSQMQLRLRAFEASLNQFSAMADRDSSIDNITVNCMQKSIDSVKVSIGDMDKATGNGQETLNALLNCDRVIQDLIAHLRSGERKDVMIHEGPMRL